MRARFLICIFLMFPFSQAVASAETSVSTDQDAGAVIIEGFRQGVSASWTPPKCFENRLFPAEGTWAPDMVIEVPCVRPASGIVRAGDELRERVIRYLPEPRPRVWPPRTALVNLPIIAASGQRPITLHAQVLGEHVTVHLTPTYRWRWGDGASLTTTRAGRAYPSREISHVFRQPCTCTVRLTTTWSGRWSFDDGTTFPLDGVLTQQAQLKVPVREAPIRLTK